MSSCATAGGAWTSAPLIRSPILADGPGVAELIKECPPLDANSTYCYVVICEHFSDTSVVAEVDGKIVGAITGYIIPSRQDTLFVWQVAVGKNYRGLGLAGRMLQNIWEKVSLRGVTEMHTTVSPSNQPSLALFQKFSEANAGKLHKTKFIRSELFGETAHEDEDLLSIKCNKTT